MRGVTFGSLPRILSIAEKIKDALTPKSDREPVKSVIDVSTADYFEGHLFGKANEHYPLNELVEALDEYVKVRECEGKQRLKLLEICEKILAE